MENREKKGSSSKAISFVKSEISGKVSISTSIYLKYLQEKGKEEYPISKSV